MNYSDNPTITYKPVQGEEFAGQIMAPVPATMIIYLSQSGWGIRCLLECCVQQINGIQNEPIHDMHDSAALDTSRFRRVAAALERLQDAGRMRFSTHTEKGQTTPILEGILDTGEQTRDIRQLLGYPPDEPIERLRLTDAPSRRAPDELAIQTRSLYATMYVLARTIGPPPEHVEKGKVHVTTAPADQEGDIREWLCVCHSRLPQLDAFAQVFYRGYWFYIPDSDWSSKRTFSLLTYLFSLQATTRDEGSPLITVPAR